MTLPIPVVGVDPGPDYALNLDACLGIIDSHNHSNGSGVQITPAGMNINADLSFGGNNATHLRSVKFSPQSSLLSLASDIGVLYESGVDLYYNDALGNQIRITASGGVNGSPGSITGLVSPASVTYVSGNQTLVFQSAANTPANLDAGFIILRNNSVLSKALSLYPPTAMGANYSLTLPSLPSVTNIMTLDASGNMAAALNVDPTYLQIVSNQITPSTAWLAAIALAIANATPTGTISAFGGAAAPAGFLICDGTSQLRASYAALYAVIGNAYGTADGSHFNLPDLRGKFPRGVNAGSGHDPDAAARTAQATGGNTGDNVGSIQADAFKAHTHTFTAYQSGSGSNLNSLGGAVSPVGETTASTGGSETRPINVYVNYIIKT
jgi:microcystin-dependent protein